MDRNTAAAILAAPHNYGTGSPELIMEACDVMIEAHRANFIGSVKVVGQLRADGADATEIREWQGYAVEAREAMEALKAWKMKAGAQWVFTGVIRIARPAPTPRQLAASRCEGFRTCGHFPA